MEKRKWGFIERIENIDLDVEGWLPDGVRNFQGSVETVWERDENDLLIAGIRVKKRVMIRGEEVKSVLKNCPEINLMCGVASRNTVGIKRSA